METRATVVSNASSSRTAPTQIHYLDLKAQFQAIRNDVMEAIARVMESQHFILGTEVDQFETEIAHYLGTPHAIACASGSDALVLSLMAAGIGPGDEVITSPFTFVATAGSIARVGATPVFVDINPETFNILPAAIDAAITTRTRAIIPVHLFGLPADMDPISSIAVRHAIPVIEDAAQAIGANYKNRAVGTIGQFGCFSFFPSKNLGGAGDGGLVVTNDSATAEKLRMLRVHGSKKKYQHELLGTNSRLDALQAAILRVKLPHLQLWTNARRVQAERYRGLFRELLGETDINIPSVPSSEYNHVYNQFTIRSNSRDELRNHLRTSGLPTEIYYPLPLHLQPAFQYLGYEAGQLPVAEKASREVLSLPIYPELSEQHQEILVRKIAAFFVPSTHAHSVRLNN